jgi:hypothetical protein
LGGGNLSIRDKRWFGFVYYSPIFRAEVYECREAGLWDEPRIIPGWRIPRVKIHADVIVDLVECVRIKGGGGGGASEMEIALFRHLISETRRLQWEVE